MSILKTVAIVLAGYGGNIFYDGISSGVGCLAKEARNLVVTVLRPGFDDD